jgi:hypothetical protein
VITWTGGGGNVSWHTPTNWSLGRVPEAGDDVVIPDMSSNVTVTFSSGSTSINSISSAEVFHLVGGSLDIVSSSSLAAGFTLSNATLSGSGNVVLTGTGNWTSGAMAGSGTTTVAAGGSLIISGGSDKFLNRTIDNHGTTNWTGGRWRFTDGRFNNLSDGVFNASANHDTAFSGERSTSSTTPARSITSAPEPPPSPGAWPSTAPDRSTPAAAT